ncbi:MAG: transcription antitermination factor NusB [Bacteroidota bacterium]
MQHLYAFDVAKRVHYNSSLSQIQQDFTPDIFAGAVPDDAQRLKAQALALFRANAQQPKLALTTSLYPEQVVASVTKAHASYHTELAKDMHLLQKGWSAAVKRICQSCVSMLQLLILWHDLARQETQSVASKSPGQYAGQPLAHNCILAQLSQTPTFMSLLKQYAMPWADKAELVTAWYHQFVKKNTRLQHKDIQSPALVEDQAVLRYLLTAILFGEEAVQTLFNDVDLNWLTHKKMVKKIVLSLFDNLSENTVSEANLALLATPTSSLPTQQAFHFYETLIQQTVAQDAELDARIEHHVKNWTLDRIMLVDRILLKLAMCEILYFEDIPAKVSMNEYLELAKAYSTPKSSLFINGILDAVAKPMQPLPNSATHRHA